MSGKTENVDVAFQMIVEAVNEYAGFIMGIPEGSVHTRLSNELPEDVSSDTGVDAESGGVPDPAGEETIDDADTERIGQARLVRETFSNICDRTNGGYALSDIGQKFDTVFSTTGVDRSALISMVHTNQPFSIDTSLAMSGLVGVSDTEKASLATEFDNNEMRTVLKHISPDLVSERTIVPERIPTGSSGDTREVSIPDLSLDAALRVSPPESLNRITSIEPGKAGIHREVNPSLGAVIIKDPLFGFNSRNANHFPVFLSAVTPLEMSRCAPYLDVKILTENRGVDNKLGIHNFLKFQAFANDEENVNFKNARPVGEAYTEVINNDVDFSYMDVFTSPQTLVNPEVNSVNNRSSFIKDIFSKEGHRTSFSSTKVRDPMQPLMTLISFNPTITGIGHGLLATKKAALKVKLHDKTRIKDLSAILSPNEFSGTKFIIEFGWSHPDGDVRSNNTLGKYLNALRDLGVYQLVNADYNFGNDNSVDITLNLVCSGFQQMKSISAAGGFHTGLDTVIDKLQNRIEAAFNQIISDGSKSERTKKIEEIRGQLKISDSDLSKNSTLIPFDKMVEWNDGWSDEFNVNDPNFDSKKMLENLIKLIYGIEQESEISQLQEAISDGLDSDGFLKLRARLDSRGVNAGDMIYAKLRSLPRGIDPFRAQVVRKFHESKGLGSGIVEVHEIPLIGIEEKTSDGTVESGARYPDSGKSDHASLGKIVSMFVGYPLSTCGLYDEVQLFFYPVNAQSAAARKHTTASFPINLNDLQEEVDRRAKGGEQSLRNLSVHAFFAILERIVSKQTTSAYSLFPENQEPKITMTKLDEFNEKSFEEKLKEAKESLGDAEISSIEASVAEGSEGVDADALRDSQNAKIISAYESQLGGLIKEAREKRLREVYEAEEEDFSGYFVDMDKFVPVNLSMYFETFSPRNGTEAVVKDLSEQILQALGNPGKRRDTVDNGKDVKKTILRIHIYDENSNMGPDIALYGAGAVNMSQTAHANKHNLGSYDFIKNLLMRRHPTIIHGASNGVINSISVASNTSGTLSNILMVEAYERSINASSDERGEPSTFDETVLLPTTVNLEMMGYPMLARGQQIFIDFGTQTSLDNLYTVKTVDHEIQAGEFKTSAILVAANQMIVSSFRARLESLMKDIEDLN